MTLPIDAPGTAWEVFCKEKPDLAEKDFAIQIFMAGYKARAELEYELDLHLGQAMQDIAELNRLKTTGCPISDQVVDKIRDRAQQGIQKFGGNMMQADRPLVEWIGEAQEEAMDMAVYLQKILISIAQMKGKVDE